MGEWGQIQANEDRIRREEEAEVQRQTLAAMKAIAEANAPRRRGRPPGAGNDEGDE